MGFESVPWVDIWPSKNCCAKSFACLIHGDPLIRCSKGWPMAHFYHHSFAFAAFFVILVWSHLLFQTGKSKGLIARTHHSEAKGWRTWLWSQGKKKKCHSYRSNFFNTFQLQCDFFSVWMSSAYLDYKYRNQSLLRILWFGHIAAFGDNDTSETFYGKYHCQAVDLSMSHPPPYKQQLQRDHGLLIPICNRKMEPDCSKEKETKHLWHLWVVRYLMETWWIIKLLLRFWPSSSAIKSPIFGAGSREFLHASNRWYCIWTTQALS